MGIFAAPLVWLIDPISPLIRWLWKTACENERGADNLKLAFVYVLFSRNKSSRFMFPQTTDSSIFVRVIHVHNICHITIKLNLYELTLLSWGRQDGGALIVVRWLPETTVQDCVSTFVSLKPLDKTGYLQPDGATISSHCLWWQNYVGQLMIFS